MNLAAQLQETINADLYWKAVESRDPRFDGHFVYAVRSTGVYCRPSCPSRHPDSKYVSFYFSPRDAELKGFRACKRCKPAEESPRLAVVHKICRFIERNVNQPLPLSLLAREANISRYHLLRTFKQALGITPRQYADQCRLQLLKSELKQGSGIADAIYGAGYGSSSRLYERTNQHLGMTPKIYVQGGRGVNIRYTIHDSPLGRVLIGATDRGICAVYIGGKDQEMLQQLTDEYPQAHIREGENQLRSWSKQLLDHLNGQRTELHLPVDVKATAFQRRVWEELQKIPYGATRTYSEIARKIGRPTAVRAVARACATNPVAVVIPCHRVVRKDGDLSGYRWGVKRKIRLLKQERG